MNREELQLRTKQFALRIVKLSSAMPTSVAGRAIASQIVRSGTSVGANYRSSCRARSRPDFISKIGIAAEETDETAYWLEILMESKLMPATKIEALHREALELFAILNSSMLTARINQQSSIKNQKS